LYGALDAETCEETVQVLVGIAGVMHDASPVSSHAHAHDAPADALCSLLAYALEALETLALEQRRQRGDEMDADATEDVWCATPPSDHRPLRAQLHSRPGVNDRKVASSRCAFCRSTRRGRRRCV
jgi:hypothetical protein